MMDGERAGLQHARCQAGQSLLLLVAFAGQCEELTSTRPLRALITQHDQPR